MQKILLALAALNTILALPGFMQPAHADPYKWCAEYGRAGGRNCYFLTLEQCRLTIAGIGGDCVPNQFYTGRDREPAHPRKRNRY